jgi:hypothetical protein
MLVLERDQTGLAAGERIMELAFAVGVETGRAKAIGLPGEMGHNR